MVNLSYQDVLELLCYASSERHPLEILGYEYSTRGMKQFRRERPECVPQVYRLIQASLEETGVFPREPSAEVLQDGTYLERRADGVAVLHTTVEESISRTAQAQVEYAFQQDAILELLRRMVNSNYLYMPSQMQKIC